MIRTSLCALSSGACNQVYVRDFLQLSTAAHRVLPVQVSVGARVQVQHPYIIHPTRIFDVQGIVHTPCEASMCETNTMDVRTYVGEHSVAM